MYITGAKFEDRCFNILEDIVYSVFYYLCGTIYDVITFLICIIQKREYLFKRQKLVQKGKRHSSWLWKSFKKSSNYFYFIGTLNWNCSPFNFPTLLSSTPSSSWASVMIILDIFHCIFHRAVKAGSQSPLLVTIAGDSFANAWSVSALGALYALYVVSIDMVDIQWLTFSSYCLSVLMI